MKLILTKKINDLIDRWWNTFIQSEDKLSGYFENRLDFDVAEFMQNNLQCIHNYLNWEYGPAISKSGHRLVITPENRKDLRPLVNAILERAPILSNWEFYAYRPAESFKLAKETTEAKTGLPLKELYFTGEVNNFNAIDLTFISLFAKDEKMLQDAKHQAFYMLESLLGEEILDKWIGAIEIETHLPENECHKPIIELCNWIKNTIDEVKNTLPCKPFYERSQDETWTLYKLEPEEKTEYPRQDDLLLGKTMDVPLWENTKCNYSFYSDRYSKLNEIFCFVKMESNECGKENLEERSQLEKILDESLISAKVGCCIGGGTGLQYSYIDFALIDLEKGLEIIKDVLRNQNIPKKAWIHFYDSDKQSEWISIWDDSPVPPMPDFEDR